jgi:chromosome segregation ATPase
MRNQLRLACMLGVVLALPMALPAFAADDVKAAKEQMRRLQQTQRKLEQEKSALEAQVSDAGGKLNQIKKAAARAERKNADLAKELKSMEEARDQLAAKLAEAEKHLAEQAEANRKLAADGQKLKADLTRQEQATASCETKNATLYQYGREMLVRYQNKGPWEAMAQREPVTGLKQVEIENVLEEYRDKLDNEKIAAPAAPLSVEPAKQ